MARRRHSAVVTEPVVEPASTASTASTASMFMDPSAFEADELERELADAGLEPETSLPCFSSSEGGKSEISRQRGGASPLALSRLTTDEDTAEMVAGSVPPWSPGSSNSYGASRSGETSAPLVLYPVRSGDKSQPTTLYGRHSKGELPRHWAGVIPQVRVLFLFTDSFQKLVRRVSFKD